MPSGCSFLAIKNDMNLYRNPSPINVEEPKLDGYGHTFIHFLYDIFISLYPDPLVTPLLLLRSAPPSHWLPPQAFYLTLSPELLNYALSSLLRSLRQSFECQLFFFTEIPGVALFIGFSACLRERMCTMPFLAKALWSYPSSRLNRALM